MKKFKIAIFFLLLVLSLTGLFSWRNYKKPAPVSYVAPMAVPVTMCGSLPVDWYDTTSFQPRILAGLGNLHYGVTTGSKPAQEFFDQGLRLLYAFNHWESIQSFREATRLDPDFAMAYWGLALAYGPNLNDINPVDREKLAYESIQKAIKRSGKVKPVEKDFINALATRYDGKSYAVRDSLNKSYAGAMVNLAKKYPDDIEVQTLCADAIMNTMPWDYWLKDGSPKSETRHAKIILENALKKFPQHPGAHHLYIHLIEASPNPEQAMPSAEFLGNAMPGAGHLVHMPAHIYLRVGQYSRSIESNERAVKVDEEYLSNSDNRGMYRWSYYPHNVDFISYSAYMEGRSSLAIQTAMKLAYKGSVISVSNPVFSQYFTAEPLYAFVRFGKWNDILSLPDPDGNFIYAQLISSFAKGLAYVRVENQVRAEIELKKLDSISTLDTLKSIYFSFNPVSEIAKVPRHLLFGEFLISLNQPDAGIAYLRKAVEAEDNLRYMEPPDWKIPARQFLGAALVEDGKYSEAEKVYQEDLKKNPENGWSLKGLLLCQQKLGKAEAAATEKRLANAWKNADVTLPSSRY